MTNRFVDIDLNFTKHPITKDVSCRYDHEAVKCAIRNLILTDYYERPFHSQIASGLKRILFEPITPMIHGIIKENVTNLIETYEPRATLMDVLTTLSPDENAISIVIVFRVTGTSTVVNTSVILERTR